MLQTGLDAFMAFDPREGVLECEAGVSLADMIEHLQPRGWFLPTTPGTKFVTLGGAIAADVHGKNHHRDGSFGQHVLDLKLMLADGSIEHCSPQRRSELFWATVGGMGLTGVILSARVRLIPVETAYYNVTYRRTRDLDQTLAAFADTDREFRYSVAWIDCLAGGASLGRSVIMLADHARAGDLRGRAADDPLRVPARSDKTVPFYFPSLALNSLGVRMFNTVYYAAHSDRRATVDYDTFFYPLDRVRHWNRIYGRRGFVQYQALFPPQTSARGLVELLMRVAASRRASFLAVLKSSGAASPGLLSYLYPGHTLALDLAMSPDMPALVAELDAILLKHGGRLYLAKDALMTGPVFREMYPRLGEFLAIKLRGRSPVPHGVVASPTARNRRTARIVDEPRDAGNLRSARVQCRYLLGRPSGPSLPSLRFFLASVRHANCRFGFYSP